MTNWNWWFALLAIGCFAVPAESADATHNLADSPTQHGRVRAMLARLAGIQPTWGDTAPLTVPNPKPPAWSPPTSKEQFGRQRPNNLTDRTWASGRQHIENRCRQPPAGEIGNHE